MDYSNIETNDIATFTAMVMPQIGIFLNYNTDQGKFCLYGRCSVPELTERLNAAMDATEYTEHQYDRGYYSLELPINAHPAYLKERVVLFLKDVLKEETKRIDNYLSSKEVVAALAAYPAKVEKRAAELRQTPKRITKSTYSGGGGGGTSEWVISSLDFNAAIKAGYIEVDVPYADIGISYAGRRELVHPSLV